jgi:hypothetical protein
MFAQVWRDTGCFLEIRISQSAIPILWAAFAAALRDEIARNAPSGSLLAGRVGGFEEVTNTGSCRAGSKHEPPGGSLRKILSSPCSLWFLSICCSDLLRRFCLFYQSHKSFPLKYPLLCRLSDSTKSLCRFGSIVCFSCFYSSSDSPLECPNAAQRMRRRLRQLE